MDLNQAQEPAALDDAQMRRVIESLYLGILERPGEPEGVEGHLRGIQAQGGLAALPGLFRIFVGSEEYKARTREGAYTDLMTRLPSQQAVQSFHHVIGIGRACATASILRRWKLRAASGPFDWLHSSAEVVEHAIADDFATFLDRSQYEDFRPADERLGLRTQHRLYGSMMSPAYSPVFNHHNPLRNDEDYRTFARHVDHFRRAIHGPHRCLLVYIAPNEGDERQAVERLIGFFDRRMPNITLNAFLVDLPDGGLVPRVAQLGDYGRHRILHFAPTSQLFATGFNGLVDEVAMIRCFSIYDFDLMAS